jgi:hypothetical protein
MKDYPQRHRLTKRRNMATRTSLVLLLLLAMTITSTVNTVTMQTTQGRPQQNISHGNPTRALSSPAAPHWAKTYGGSGWEQANSVQQTSDGGYIVAGDTNSSGVGDYDVWVLKLNSTGGITWQKTYGGSGEDCAYSIQQPLTGVT